MNQYIAFLRAVNVGGRFVKMAELRRQFDPPTFNRVQTYIQSGNVIFESPLADPAALEVEIEDRLGRALDFEVPAFVRPAAAVRDLAAHWPFAEAEPEAAAAYYVSFLKEAPEPGRRERLLAASGPLDEFHFYGPHLFWRWRRALGKSAFTNTGLERLLAVQATRRNLNTLRKLAAKYLASSA